MTVKWHGSAVGPNRVGSRIWGSQGHVWLRWYGGMLQQRASPHGETSSVSSATGWHIGVRMYGLAAKRRASPTRVRRAWST